MRFNSVLRGLISVKSTIYLTTWLNPVRQKFLNVTNSIYYNQPRAGSSTQIAAYSFYNTPQEAVLDNIGGKTQKQT
jgi:hypothetical protein